MQPVRSMWFFMILIPMIPHIYGEECLSSSSGVRGSCVPIQECPYLSNYLAKARRGDNAALQLLRSSVCSQSNVLAKVCCPRFQGGFPERCGGNNNTERIVGGENALLTSWPWMALLRASGGEFQSWICGGVLISARYVLTAAHCVTHTVYTVKSVRLGELVLNENPDSGGNLVAPDPQDILVQDIIVHDQYQKPTSCPKCNDIALLKLASPARLDNLFVEPICIANSPYIPPEDKAWVAGWGVSTTDPHFFTQATHLQQLQVPIQELNFCRDRKRVYPDPNMIFCAGGETKKDTCRGDSGGPLMLAFNNHKWYAIGIVSFGNTICGAAGSQSIFTNVNYYRQWIEDNLLP